MLTPVGNLPGDAQMCASMFGATLLQRTAYPVYRPRMPDLRSVDVTLREPLDAAQWNHTRRRSSGFRWEKVSAGTGWGSAVLKTAVRVAVISVAAVGSFAFGAPAWAGNVGNLPIPLLENFGANDTPRTAAMGGAARAVGDVQSGAVLNPASLATTRSYQIAVLGQISPEPNRQVYGGTVVDSVSGKLAGGVSVLAGFLKPDFSDTRGFDRTTIDARLGLAYGFVDRIYLGIAGRYFEMKQSGEGPLGPSKFSSGLRKADGGQKTMFRTGTVDVGLTLRATDSLYVAVLGQNLSFPKVSVMPTTFGGGVGFNARGFTIEADAVGDFVTYGKATAQAMVGAEYLVVGKAPVRVGYRWDQGSNAHALSGGLGYVGKDFCIEVSVRREVNYKLTSVFATIGYFLDGSGASARPAD